MNAKDIPVEVKTVKQLAKFLETEFPGNKIDLKAKSADGDGLVSDGLKRALAERDALLAAE